MTKGLMIFYLRFKTREAPFLWKYQNKNLNGGIVIPITTNGDTLGEALDLYKMTSIHNFIRKETPSHKIINEKI